MNTIKDAILIGKFEKAKELLENEIEAVNLYDYFMEMAWVTQSLAPYGMIVYLISHRDASFLHTIAAHILATALCHIEGVYTLALFHAMRAVELDPENIESKQFLLLFHDIPEHLISTEEALEIAKGILEKDPENPNAKKFINDYQKKI